MFSLRFLNLVHSQETSWEQKKITQKEKVQIRKRRREVKKNTLDLFSHGEKNLCPRLSHTRLLVRPLITGCFSAPLSHSLAFSLTRESPNIAKQQSYSRRTSPPYAIYIQHTHTHTHIHTYIYIHAVKDAVDSQRAVRMGQEEIPKALYSRQSERCKKRKEENLVPDLTGPRLLSCRTRECYSDYAPR